MSSSNSGCALLNKNNVFTGVNSFSSLSVGFGPFVIKTGTIEIQAPVLFETVESQTVVYDTPFDNGTTFVILTNNNADLDDTTIPVTLSYGLESNLGFAVYAYNAGATTTAPYTIKYMAFGN
jgi:hypothetical protein